MHVKMVSLRGQIKENHEKMRITRQTNFMCGEKTNCRKKGLEGFFYRKNKTILII